jgi:CrcB protein
MMTPVISVALGGALGSVLRYFVGFLVAFPMGTLAINVLGSFLIGVAWLLLAARGLHHWIPFVMMGVLGGFTTFSTFSLDTIRLIEAERFLAAASYVLASVVLSIAACALGLWLARGITP